eukprot:COSAG02_NODE_1430_length_12650_cov_5.887260_7_plen_44_part_00
MPGGKAHIRETAVCHVLQYGEIFHIWSEPFNAVLASIACATRL